MNAPDDRYDRPYRTAAGRRLLGVMAGVPPDGLKGLAWFVEQIETEARAAERNRIKPWVEAIGCLNLDTGRRFRKADVLRVIDMEVAS